MASVAGSDSTIYGFSKKCALTGLSVRDSVGRILGGDRNGTDTVQDPSGSNFQKLTDTPPAPQPQLMEDLSERATPVFSLCMCDDSKCRGRILTENDLVSAGIASASKLRHDRTAKDSRSRKLAIPFFYVGNRVRYRECAVREFMNSAQRTRADKLAHKSLNRKGKSKAAS